MGRKSMNVASAIKNTVSGGRGQLLLSGALLGIYVSVLHAVPFMRSSDFFVVFALIVLSAVIIPVAAAIWSRKGANDNYKAHQILKGMTVSLAAFTLIYLAETLVGNYLLKILANPMRFPISREPHISLLTSIILLSLSLLASIKLKEC